jgi:UDP-N-acetylmuramoyl-L-alanyl-D-glutamate--2,6-diaminopimelate ligase
MRVVDLVAQAPSHMPRALAQSEVTSITQDSRAITHGTLFFAIEGTTHDGHEFVADVLNKGAIAAVVRTGHPLISKLRGVRVIEVDDTRRALGLAASAFYGKPSEKLTVCGVTGTNGKTTSTFLLEAILKGAGFNPAIIGTVENRLGDFRIPSSHTTPDAPGLQKLFADFLTHGATAVAMEVSSHALEQQRTAGTHFKAALFTNLTQDHLDYHGTMEAYFIAKTKLFLDYPEIRARAIHADDNYGKRLIELCTQAGHRTVTFGRVGCDINYGELRFSAAGIEGELELSKLKKRVRLQSRMIGAFNAQNLSGAMAVAIGLGIDPDLAAKALSHATPVPGRVEPVANTKGLHVIVDYAHTPDALENALKTLRPLCRGKLICVFGCGGDRDPTKRSIMGAIAEKLSDEIIVTSDNPRTEDPEKILDDIFDGISRKDVALRIGDRRQAIHEAIKRLNKNDILLIAGKGHEDYQIIGTQKFPFDDRKVALEAIIYN